MKHGYAKYRSLAKLTGVALLLAAVWPGVAHAYIDPGSVTIAVQLIGASVFGFLFAFRRVVLDFIKRLVGREIEQEFKE